MRHFSRVAFFTVIAGLLAPGAFAQVLKVPEKLNRGDKITIEYSDAGRAGETILLEIDDGAFPVAHVVEIPITLDSSGKGSADWVVLSWDSAAFNAPGVHEIHRWIN